MCGPISLVVWNDQGSIKVLAHASKNPLLRKNGKITDYSQVANSHTNILSSHGLSVLDDAPLERRKIVRIETYPINSYEDPIYPGDDNWHSNVNKWHIEIDETDSEPLWYTSKQNQIEKLIKAVAAAVIHDGYVPAGKKASPKTTSISDGMPKPRVGEKIYVADDIDEHNEDCNNPCAYHILPSGNYAKAYRVTCGCLQVVQTAKFKPTKLTPEVITECENKPIILKDIP